MEFREIFQKGRELFAGRAKLVEHPVDVKRMILSGHEPPPRAKIIVAFLETALLVTKPRLPGEGGKREESPEWLKSIYKRSNVRHENCKDLAALLVPSSEVKLEPILKKPLISEEARKDIATEIVKSVPILVTREEQLEETERLAQINFKRKDKYNFFTPLSEKEAQKRQLKASLTTLSDEELKSRLLHERQRITNDVLSKIYYGVRF